jgi:hypothetical protein
MAMSDKEKQEMLSRMTASPISPMEMMNPLYKFDEMVRGAAMNVVGPAKFKSALKLIPTIVDKGDNLKDLLKFDDFLMNLGTNERKELAGVALPKVLEGQRKTESIMRSDVLGNPNASATTIRNLELNERHYGSMARKLQSILDDTYQPMQSGGLATLL